MGGFCAGKGFLGRLCRQGAGGLWGSREAGGRVLRPHVQSSYPIFRTARASAGPVFKGVCKQFSRSQGHGFITPENGSEDIFVHVSE